MAATITITPTGPVDVGDTRRITVTWTDLVGAAADPTTVTVRAKPPLSPEISFTYDTDDEVVHDPEDEDAVGIYYVDLAFTEAGTWAIRWVATGDVAEAEELSLVVRRSAFPNP